MMEKYFYKSANYENKKDKYIFDKEDSIRPIVAKPFEIKGNTYRKP